MPRTESRQCDLQLETHRHLPCVHSPDLHLGKSVVHGNGGCGAPVRERRSSADLEEHRRVIARRQSADVDPHRIHSAGRGRRYWIGSMLIV